MSTPTYALRSDHTVVATDPMSGRRVAYRVWPNNDTGLQRSKPLSVDNARAVFDPNDLTVVYDSTVSSMLRGSVPKSSHGFLGMLGGLATGGMVLGGVAGWLGGAIAGLVVGHLIETAQNGVQMSPVIQVRWLCPRNPSVSPFLVRGPIPHK